MKSSKLIIFDLDDTLYREIDFFKEGLLTVSNFAEDTFGLSAKLVFKEFMDIFNESGRTNLFNYWLKSKGFQSKNVKTMVQLYRYHQIEIEFPSQNARFLKSLGKNIYLITDGNKLVQRRKIESFGLRNIFKRCLITNQYGVKFQKPDSYSFELVRKMERSCWSDMIYVGDNPTKDFLFLNSQGGTTIQTLQYRTAENYSNLSIAHSAQYLVNSLEEIEKYF
jgi:putative hydrolase of the HAD superfamily